MDEIIVVRGNPIDGLEFFGPFDSEDDATEWADNHRDSRDWWVAYVTKPDKGKEDT